MRQGVDWRGGAGPGWVSSYENGASQFLLRVLSVGRWNASRLRENSGSCCEASVRWPIELLVERFR